MEKPSKTMKITIDKKSNFVAYYRLNNYNRMLSFMEFKMLLRYNKNKRSMYTPTKRETAALITIFDEIIWSKDMYDLKIDDFTYDIIQCIRDAARNNQCISLNKRALLMLINRIKKIWIVFYPSAISIKEDRGY